MFKALHMPKCSFSRRYFAQSSSTSDCIQLDFHAFGRLFMYSALIVSLSATSGTVGQIFFRFLSSITCFYGKIKQIIYIVVLCTLLYDCTNRIPRTDCTFYSSFDGIHIYLCRSHSRSNISELFFSPRLGKLKEQMYINDFPLQSNES